MQDMANLADSVGLKVSDGSSILSGSTKNRPFLIVKRPIFMKKNSVAVKHGIYAIVVYSTK